jgi:[ribosomal protein S5]-alanine N-acetyltransferase
VGFTPVLARRLLAYLQGMRSPGNAGFLLRNDGKLVGVVNINNIVMGVLESGYLGYYAFKGSENKGLLTQGLALVIKLAFGKLGLHRLEANIQPSNLALIRLVRKVGLVKEGFSERYLYVAGEWRGPRAPDDDRRVARIPHTTAVF